MCGFSKLQHEPASAIAVENGVVGGGAKAGETLQIRLVKAEVLEEQWGGRATMFSI